MADLIVRGLDSEIIKSLNRVKGDLSREAYLRNLITSSVEEKMYAKGFLVSNLKDIQQFSSNQPKAVLDTLQCMYENNLISYPKTVSRHLHEADWKQAPVIIEQTIRFISGDIYSYKKGIIVSNTYSLKKIQDLHAKVFQRVERGYPPPRSLYNNELWTDNPGISPVPNDWDQNKFYQQADNVLEIYAFILSNYITALSSALADDSVSDAKSPWIPFREKATGRIVAARWEEGVWEVAGEQERVQAEVASECWETV